MAEGCGTIKILTYVSDLHIENKAGGCKFCLTAVKDYSKHDITLCGINEVDKINFDDFDIIHTHEKHQKFLMPTKAKLVFGMHGFGLNCPTGGFQCFVLNNLLDEPLTCLNCLGYLGIKTGGENLKKCIALARKADVITVDCNFMKEFYHNYNPYVLPLPLETDILTPCKDKDEYIFYTGRFSLDKNPHGFLDIINKTGFKGKMAIYDAPNDILGIKNHFKEIIENKNKNLEILVNPSKKAMIEIVKHARFTVLPYFFAEPFGVAAANSVLCGTPLIAFPYGNARNMTHLLPKTLEEMIQLLKMDDKQYQEELEKTLKKSEELRNIHSPKNAIQVWDGLYNSLL